MRREEWREEGREGGREGGREEKKKERRKEGREKGTKEEGKEEMRKRGMEGYNKRREERNTMFVSMSLHSYLYLLLRVVLRPSEKSSVVVWREQRREPGDSHYDEALAYPIQDGDKMRNGREEAPAIKDDNEHPQCSSQHEECQSLSSS